MRIICLYQHAPTPGAPGIYRHRRLLAEMVRRGHSVHLISTPVNYMTGLVPPRYRRRLYRREKIEGITHHWVWAWPHIHRSRLDRALNYVTFACTAAVAGLVLRRPTIVWVSSPPLPLGVVGEVLARRHRRPWIYEVRDLWPESTVSVGWLEQGSGLYRFLLRVARHLARSADGVLATTPGLVAGLEAHGAPRVDVVSGAMPEITLDAARRARTRARLGVGDDVCLFAYVGALGVANGLDTLIDAAKAVPSTTGLHVVLAGDGSDRARVAERLAGEHVPNLTLLEPLPKDEVIELVEAADVCLHLLRPDALFEGALPTKILEYFGARRPVITTTEGLPARIVTEAGGEHCRDADGLAEALARWASMDALERRERGERSHAYGARHFGFGATADALESHLQRVVEGARR